MKFVAEICFHWYGKTHRYRYNCQEGRSLYPQNPRSRRRGPPAGPLGVGQKAQASVGFLWEAMGKAG